MTKDELIKKWNGNLEFANNLPDTGEFSLLFKNGQLATIKELLRDLESLAVDEVDKWISPEKESQFIDKIQELRSALYSLTLSVKAHPDYTGEENDEWTDLIETAEDAMDNTEEYAE